MFRIFEIIGNEQLELYDDDDRLIGVYVPGLRYNCLDDDSHAALAKTLDQWLADGVAKIVEERPGTQSAQLGGLGKVE